MKLKRLPQILLDQLFGFVEWFIIFAPDPLGSRLRNLFWKMRLKSLGKNVKFGIGVRIANPKNVSIGHNCWLDDYVLITAGPLNYDGKTIFRKTNPDFRFREGEIIIGDYVHIAPFVILQGHGGIEIGSCLTIAAGSKIYSLIHTYRDQNSSSNKRILYKFVGLVPSDEQSLVCASVVIHDNAAVGLNSVILPGSIIGSNSWLGAQSLLNGILPANVIAYGNPAKVIKSRYD